MATVKWTNYVLPQDILSVAKELNVQRDLIVRAIQHLEQALERHNDEEFHEARRSVGIALDRLEDWKRSDDVILEAHKRFYEEERKRYEREKLIEALEKDGYKVILIKQDKKGERTNDLTEL